MFVGRVECFFDLTPEGSRKFSDTVKQLSSVFHVFFDGFVCGMSCCPDVT